MPEDNQKDTAQKQADLEKEHLGVPEGPEKVTNPFTGEKVVVTPEEIEGVSKQTEANTERD
jgi:hypothetical protein